ncbi:MAG: patatin-like phospholipase family protein [Verrucomicrobia bacterium]|nr:patatin-like phospholipase family protein [Verrucomicrobiota bacterium]MBV8378262.1 patatin-like phospholipase family protein [Verrucomicrobiota bacterium]
MQEVDQSETRRILSLDGGGLRAFFTLEVLERVEALVRRRLGREDAVLADHFDLIAGTSTGAILGAFLAWGLSIAKIKTLYEEMAGRVFRPYRNPLQWLRNRYAAETLSSSLREFFVEEGPQGLREATLGSAMLRTVFLVVLRNASTGSAWPLCSHPALKYNARERSDCNLDLALWRIVRASTAAPTFFAPERIRTGDSTFQFVDGGVTPYNNPALIAALMVTEPCFNIRWPSGEDRLYVLSAGTGQTRVRYANMNNFWELALPAVVSKTITALIEGSTQQQDFLCRIMGRCLHGPVIDTEVGELIAPQNYGNGNSRRFTYVRYNTDFTSPEFASVLSKYGGDVPMDLPVLIPTLQALGQRYALSEVREEHLR